MKVAGVIAEFNPFHNGHSYFLKQAKEETGADYCVVLMSGDYVQRGTPALTDKYTRTRAALANGADLVLELPVYSAAGSAEQFAAGAVAILSKLGVIDTLVFGAEANDLSMLNEIACILAKEPSAYRTALKEALTGGLSYPAASAKAVGACLPTVQETVSAALKAPNNILAIAYLCAIIRQNSPLKTCMVKRSDSGYHSHVMTPPYASAGALRDYIAAHSEQPLSETARVLAQYMPESALFAMGLYNGCFYPAQEAPFSLLLHRELLRQPQGLTAYCDVSDALANRIENLLWQYRSFSQFSALCASKDTTQAHVRRALLHILLGITDAHLSAANALQHAPYVRMLGCRRDAAPLLHEIKAHISIPFIAKPAQVEKLLGKDALALWQLDIAASHIYRICQTSSYGILSQNEYTRSICGLTGNSASIII